jgi:hypothetical protein
VLPDGFGGNGSTSCTGSFSPITDRLCALPGYLSSFDDRQRYRFR